MESEETFNEKFASIDETLKYIADSQAKSEWIRKKADVEHRAKMQKFEEESERRRAQYEEESRQSWERIKKNLDHITKLTGIVFDDLDFQNEKLTKAGKTLSIQNPAIERSR